MKIALICSHGGHLTEMTYLIDAFAQHDIFFITYDNIRTRNLKYQKYLFPNFGEKPYKMLLNFANIINILLKEKPDILVSNGAEIAIPFFYIGRLLRIRTIFIECYTRIDKPTITGKLVYPISELFLVLWPEMLTFYGKNAEYWGNMFNLEDHKTPGISEEQILVITGMHSGFDRLVKKVDEIAGENKERFVIQSGNASYNIKNAEHFKFKEYNEIKSLIKDSKLVICPGAMSAVDSLYLGTPVMIVPRSKDEGEVINDHQRIFAEKLESQGLVKIVNNLDDLKDSISNFDGLKNSINLNKGFLNQLKKFVGALNK
jgi:beta-1,4-N-acetylglucosaminyltransferase